MISSLYIKTLPFEPGRFNSTCFCWTLCEQQDGGSDCGAVEGSELLCLAFLQGSSCLASWARKCPGGAIEGFSPPNLHMGPQSSLDNFPFLTQNRYPVAIDWTATKMLPLSPETAILLRRSSLMCSWNTNHGPAHGIFWPSRRNLLVWLPIQILVGHFW